MYDYEIIFIATNIIFTFAIYNLYHAFFDDNIHNHKIEKLSYLLYFVMSSGFVFFARIPVVNLVFTLTFLFLISFNYISSIQKKIIFTFLIYSILFVIEMLVTVGIGFLEISAVMDSPFDSDVGLILMRIVTMITAYLINRYKGAVKKDVRIPAVYYLAYTVALAGTLYLFANSLEKEDLTIYSVAVSGAVLIAVNVTIIIIDEKIYHSIIEMNEKNILKQQNIAYENQVKLINQSAESMRALKHDMNNHLIMLKQMLGNDKTDEIDFYISRIFEQIDHAVISESDNFVIDSIVNVKLRKLQDMGTQILLDINVPKTINILAYDITVIMGNLFDNAITAIEQCQNKKFYLKISCSKGNLIILMDNSFNGNLLVENGIYKTTKACKDNHGNGFLNIEKSLESYGGEIRTEYTNDTFSVAVIIPYQN